MLAGGQRSQKMDSVGSEGEEPCGNLDRGRTGKCKGPEAGAESKEGLAGRMGWDRR